MTASSPPSAPASGRAATLGAWTAAAVAAAAAIWLGIRLDRVESALARIEPELQDLGRTAHLLRIEGRSQGRGIGAIVEQIDFWAPQLASVGTPHPAADRIESSLHEALEAVGALGEDAWPTLMDALQATPRRDDETRKWLLLAAFRARPAQGRALLASVMRGTKLDPSPRLRFFAADELLRRDKQYAATVLKDILELESARGITRQVPPGLAPEYERVIGTNAFPDFYNFIARFVRSGHPDTERVLRMILGRADHDKNTYREVIRALADLGSEPAVPRIKELYASPPDNYTDPLFMNVCVQAIADIQGADAREWLREQLRTVEIDTVRTKLQDLLKQL